MNSLDNLTKEEVLFLGTTKSLQRLCYKLIDKGIPKREIVTVCEDSGYENIPGKLGHRFSQSVKGLSILGLGALGVYIGSKINSLSLGPEIIGGLLGFAMGLNGLNYSEAENTPLITLFIEKYPEQLKEIYKEDGFTDEEIKNIFSRDRVSEMQKIVYG